MCRSEIVRYLRWPIRDIKTQLLIMGNLNSKTYYFRFAVLFSYLQYFPLLKPKFFLLTLIFLKNSDFFKTQFFFLTQIFLKKNSDVFKTQGFFSELRFFRKNEFLFKIQFKQCACHIPVDHDCWFKENEQNGVDDQWFYLFSISFCAFHVERA